jgi:hypothetical protein
MVLQPLLDNGATSSAGRPCKRARIVESDGDGLAAAFKQASETLSDAIKEVAKVGNYLLEGLFETMTSLLGFEHDHKSFYFQYLVNNAHVARAFSSLPFDHKITWITKFVSDNFNI